ARRILIKQCVPEKNPRLRDRRVVRNQSNLAKPAGTIVGRNELPNGFFALCRGHLDDAAVFESAANVFDERPLVREWFRCSDYAVDAVLVRRREAFFGWNVRLAVNAVARSRPSAGPQVLVGESHRE